MHSANASRSATATGGSRRAQASRALAKSSPDAATRSSNDSVPQRPFPMRDSKRACSRSRRAISSRQRSAALVQHGSSVPRSKHSMPRMAHAPKRRRACVANRAAASRTTSWHSSSAGPVSAAAMVDGAKHAPTRHAARRYTTADVRLPRRSFTCPPGRTIPAERFPTRPALSARVYRRHVTLSLRDRLIIVTRSARRTSYGATIVHVTPLTVCAFSSDASST